jgi:hypothetical protein
MTVIAQALSRAFPASSDASPLKTIVMFCSLGLLISLCMVVAGLDLTAGLPL